MRWSDSALPFGRSHPECQPVAAVCAYSMSLMDGATRCVAVPHVPHALPEPRDSVDIEDRVGADQGQRFDQALGGEHPVERVPMMQRQNRDVQRVTALDREHFHLVTIQMLAE